MGRVDSWAIASIALLAEARRQERAVTLTQEKGGLPVLSPEFISRCPINPDEILFILGSGESVLKLSDEQWGQVRRSTSIGIGAWTIHPFVPDFIALEHITKILNNDDDEAGETSLERSYREALEGWHSRPTVQEQQPNILFFRPPTVGDFSRLLPLKGYWEGRTAIYGRIGCNSRNLSELSKEFGSYLRKATRGKIPIFLPFDTGSTVIRLTVLGALMGFKKIVLVGVDVRNSRYFWEASPDLLSLHGMTEFRTPEDSKQHSTETRGRLPFSDALPIISSQLWERLGARVLVGHESSWLSKLVPLFDWSSGSRNLEFS